MERRDKIGDRNARKLPSVHHASGDPSRPVRLGCEPRAYGLFGSFGVRGYRLRSNVRYSKESQTLSVCAFKTGPPSTRALSAG